jgi:hypothetical protein
MNLPSGLKYTNKPGYELREEYQPFIDSNRGGGFKGDSDLCLQIVLGQMDVWSNPSIGLCKELNRLYKLEKICNERFDGNKDRSFHLESKLLTPSDIDDAFKRYNI